MKTKKITLLITLLALLPSGVLAQDVIRKPDIAERIQTTASNEEGTVTYKSGFLFKDTVEKSKTPETHSLKIGGRVQFRYRWTADDTGDGYENAQAFMLRRARMSFVGHTFTKKLNYKVQTLFGRGQVGLKDFYFDYRYGPNLMIRMGKNKVWYSRQQITSSGRVIFVDRANTHKAILKDERDVGLTLGSGFKNKPFEWHVSLYNGNGESGVPDDISPRVVGRFVYNHGPIKGYDEVDWQGGPLRFAIGLNMLSNLNLTNDSQDAQTHFGGDLIIKAEHFTFATEAHYNLDTETTSLQALGGYIIDGSYLPALQFSMDKTGDVTAQEIGAAFNIYWRKHGMKWTTDISALIDDDGSNNTTNMRLRSQVQLLF